MDEGHSGTIFTSTQQLINLGNGVFAIPEGTTEIRISENISPYSNVYRAITIPASVKKIIGLNRILQCTAYVVSENSTHYTTIDGVLYTKDKKVLVAYPTGRFGGAKKDLNTYVVLTTVEYIADEAFLGNRTLHSVVLPHGLMQIGQRAFSACLQLMYINLPEGLRSVGPHCFADSRRINRLHFSHNIAELYTSNLSSGITIEIDTELTNLIYDSIPDSFSIDTENIFVENPVFTFRPILLSRNNPVIQQLAARYNFPLISRYYTDENDIIWAGDSNDCNKVMICFPARWNSDRYQVRGHMRISELAFWATEVQYLWANWCEKDKNPKDTFEFIGGMIPDYDLPPNRYSETVYETRPNRLPSSSELPENSVFNLDSKFAQAEERRIWNNNKRISAQLQDEFGFS